MAILTGSKNALKGVGFFLGALLLTVTGFRTALLILAAFTLIALVLSSQLMHGHLGKPDSGRQVQADVLQQPSGQRARRRAHLPVRRARRVVRRRPAGLPAHSVLGWTFWQAGAFLAALGDRLRGGAGGRAPLGALPRRWSPTRARRANGAVAGARARAVPAAIAIALEAGVDGTLAIIVGLVPFGVVFALNSAVHSYLILAYSDSDKVAMNVGFYYMANALGRLAGTVLSGVMYEWHGLEACLWTSTAFVLITGALSVLLPTGTAVRGQSAQVSQPA